MDIKLNNNEKRVLARIDSNTYLKFKNFPPLDYITITNLIQKKIVEISNFNTFKATKKGHKIATTPNLIKISKEIRIRDEVAKTLRLEELRKEKEKERERLAIQKIRKERVKSQFTKKELKFINSGICYTRSIADFIGIDRQILYKILNSDNTRQLYNDEHLLVKEFLKRIKKELEITPVFKRTTWINYLEFSKMAKFNINTFSNKLNTHSFTDLDIAKIKKAKKRIIKMLS